MSLLDELAEQQFLDSKVLTRPGIQARSSTGIERVRQLCRQRVLDEDQLQPFFSLRYSFPLLSQSELTPTPFPDQAFCWQVFQETKVLLVVLGEEYSGLLSIHSDLTTLDKIAFHLDQPVSWYWCTQEQIEGLWQTADNIEWKHEDISVVEIAHNILEQAILQRCSDVHLEALGEELAVRFRIDGRLQDAMQFPIETQAPLLSRFKILAGMDIAVKRRPQDGYHAYQSRSGEHFDLRVSSVPTESGEKLVIRLLDQTPVHFRLEGLGFLGDDLEVLYQACRATNGLILVSGPTGSGKTTTLYAMLNEINSREKNIMTIEDPVEYHIPGINQVSVRPDQGLTFENALKAFLRQDPDVILIGEIRDQATAEIAIKAALTGHLVLATLHSTDAVTTIQRMRNLGIDLDLLAETLKVVLCQRLVRRLRPVEQRKEGKSKYIGRIPMYEILQVDRLVNERIKSGKLGKKLIESGDTLFFHSFAQTAERFVEDGITDHEEIDPILWNL